MSSDGSYRDWSEKYGLSHDEWWVEVRPRKNPKYQGKFDKGNSQIKLNKKRGRPRKQGPKIESEARDHGDYLDHHQQQQLASDHPGREEAAKSNKKRGRSRKQSEARDGDNLDHHQQLATNPDHQEAARDDHHQQPADDPVVDQWILQRVPPKNNGKPISPEKENENGDKAEPSDMQLDLTKESTPLTDATADANDHPQPRFKVLLPEALQEFKKSPGTTKPPKAPSAKKKRASDYKFDFRSPPKKVRWEATFVEETKQCNWEPFVGVRPVPAAIKELWAETFESVTKPKDKTPKE
ncbi:hypothetical protein COLO4_14796 [Corchorus olitorius]|uniref:Uncharacterized protein n=1 Tax=Corchorus olitorius TaxID=93759 RepID=A0A1R3JQW2_9ROSI|nr:hypothetical protein COLO4_14796 [Corchorus olitorius]